MDTGSKKVLKYLKRNSGQSVEVADVSLFLRMKDATVKEKLNILLKEKLAEKTEQDGVNIWKASVSATNTDTTTFIDFSSEVTRLGLVIAVVVAIIISSGLSITMSGNGGETKALKKNIKLLITRTMGLKKETAKLSQDVESLTSEVKNLKAKIKKISKKKKTSKRKKSRRRR